MHIAVIGATGSVGRELVDQGLERGHLVTAFSRDASGIKEKRANVNWRSLDVLDAEAVRSELEAPGVWFDAVVSLFQPGNASRDFADTVARSIADPTVYATAARNLLGALAQRPRTRLIVVGGAGSLEIAPGVVRVDHDELVYEALDELGLPREYITAVQGHRDAFNVLRASNRLWTYLSPAEQIGPGERTNRYRIGGDQPVLDAEGRSRISVPDAAAALLDEIELPRFIQRRFTIGY
ncbi:NAD(P)-dependent oxidoreductase [Kitasatospora sp. HPMI-4]|uniref:NAD(P)-dependent oxidoreductase n=1 Tax=Kitasatospora sp. HPMI-4 TaxID=3448443 RepID=UPI003F1CF7AE